MIDRIPTAPLVAPAVRLHAWYRSAASLLRDLSRALNQGQTILRADSGLPVGTHLVLVMSAGCLSAPLEVQGTVTRWRVRGRRHEMTLRYDFDPGPQRRRLAEAMAELRRQTRRPRRGPRVPLALAAESSVLRRRVTFSVVELSRAGARFRITGSPLPEIEPGSRLEMRVAGRRLGARTPLRLSLEVRWVGSARRSRGHAVRELGGRFVGLTPAARRRLDAILRFDEARPELSLRTIASPKRGRRRAPAQKATRRRRAKVRSKSR